MKNFLAIAITFLFLASCADLSVDPIKQPKPPAADPIKQPKPPTP